MHNYAQNEINMGKWIYFTVEYSKDNNLYSAQVKYVSQAQAQIFLYSYKQHYTFTCNQYTMVPGLILDSLTFR